MRKTMFILVLVLASMGLLWGQYSIAANSTNYTQDFDTLANTGSGITWTNGTTLSGWYAKTDATASIVTYGTNAGTTTAGALYSFGTASATDRAFGFASSNSYTGASGTGKGYIGWRLKNNTGSTITSLSVTWTGEQWRKENNASAHTLNLFYQTGTTVTDLTAGTWTTATSTFTTPIIGATTAAALDGNLAANRVAGIVATISGLSLASGDEIMLRWEDLNDVGNDHLMAIDDVTINATSGAAPPSLTVISALTAFSTTTGTPSAAQTYTVAGANLTANIGIAAVTGFAYSTDGTNYFSTLSLAPTSGTVATTTISVRLTGATAGTPSGNIAHTSAGATQVDVAVSGTVTAPAPTITLSAAALNAFSAYVGTPSAAQTYTVAGTFLTANISIAAVAGFEYSTNGTSYSSTLSLTPTSGTVATTTIYVRLTGTTLGDYSGNITHTSTGATQQDKAITGSVVAVPSATTLLEENFEYPENDLLTAHGWTAHSGGGTNSFFVGSTGLSYTGYPANSGLCAQSIGTTGEDVNRLFTPQTMGSVYASLLVNLSTVNVAGDYFFHLGPDPLGTDFKGRVFAQKEADPSNMIRFGISRGGAIATAIWTGYTYSLDTTYLLVMKYTIVSGATNDQVVLWINPTIGATEPTPLLTSTDVAAADPANIAAVAFRQASTTNPSPTPKYDGIRVTNSWQQLWVAPVTPVLHTSVVEIEAPFACISGIPSEEVGSYTLYGTDTASEIVVTAPDHFQVSTSETEGWDSALNLANDFNGTIYVRMSSSTVGLHDGNITHTSGSATTVNVFVSGECLPPAVVWNITQNITAFSAQAGTASANQSYTLSTTTATGDITVTTTAPFELSTTGVSGWNQELTLAYTFSGTVYVRMNSAAAGDFTADITHATTGASPSVIHISGNATPAAGQAYDLFFSEYVEGSSNNKAIEIFNGTGAAVNLANYSIKKQVNGAGAFGNEYTLSGTLANNDVYVIVYSSATGSLKDELYVDLASTLGFMSFNGNDAVALYHSGVQTDVIGIVDQAADWGKDVTLVRKPTIIAPTTTFSFDDWNAFPIDTFTDLGTHTFGTGGTPEMPVVVITKSGANVVLTWEAVPGANGGYRIESSNDPYTGFTTVTTTPNLTWSEAASVDKKFYQVIALP